MQLYVLYTLWSICFSFIFNLICVFRGLIASQISRYIQKNSSVWATGNYVLDYEDRERGYGGLLQLISIGSERTGLPNVFIFMAEQHSLGVTTSYAVSYNHINTFYHYTCINVNTQLNKKTNIGVDCMELWKGKF